MLQLETIYREYPQLPLHIKEMNFYELMLQFQKVKGEIPAESDDDMSGIESDDGSDMDDDAGENDENAAVELAMSISDVAGEEPHVFFGGDASLLSRPNLALLEEMVMDKTPEIGELILINWF